MVDLSRYNNDWYKEKIGASMVKQVCWYYTNVFLFKSSWLLSSGVKCSILRFFGAKIGKGVVVKPNVNIKYPWKLSIGDYSWIGENVWLDNLDEIRIGANCCISQGVVFITGNHNYTLDTFDLFLKPIHLEDGVWIGAGALVAPGTYCHSHCVIAMGSIVNGIYEPWSVYAGNPLQKVRPRNNR